VFNKVQRAAIPLRARVDAPAHQSCNSAALALAGSIEIGGVTDLVGRRQGG
jgi:hypothetical protein